MSLDVGRAATRLIATAMLFVAAGCGTTAGVGYSRDLTCQPSGLDADTYVVETDGMPSFLEPLFVFVTHQSLQSVGFRPSEDPDLRVTLRFEFANQDSPAPAKDPFEGPRMSNEPMRFFAIVHVSVVRRDGRVAWAGSLQRYHTLMGDEIFHADKAVRAVQYAMDQMFEGMTTICPD